MTSGTGAAAGSGGFAEPGGGTGGAGPAPKIGRVRISDVRGTQMAAEITGTFEVDGEPLEFTAIAFGRIGGQNVGARLGEAAERRLAAMGYGPEGTILALQQMLVRGDIEIPEGLEKETFADRPP